LRVIYADILFVINLALDYLLLFGTARLAGAKFERIKGLFGAMIGAIYSFVILFELPKTVFAATKLAVSVLMVLMVFGKRKPTEILRLIAIFYICGFLFSGFMMLMNSVFKADGFFIKGGIIYFEVSAMKIVISGTAAFVITEILRRLFRHGEPEGSCMVKIFYEGKSVVLKGFTDTGNSLCEPLSGSPVAVVFADSLEKILSEEMLLEMESEEMSTDIKIRTVFCKTVSGAALLKAFRPERFIIENENGKFEAEDILVASSNQVPENTAIIGKNILLKKIKNSLQEA